MQVYEKFPRAGSSLAENYANLSVMTLYTGASVSMHGYSYQNKVLFSWHKIISRIRCGNLVCARSAWESSSHPLLNAAASGAVWWTVEGSWAAALLKYFWQLAEKFLLTDFLSRKFPPLNLKFSSMKTLPYVKLPSENCFHWKMCREKSIPQRLNQ